MTGWADQELERIGAADELEIAPFRAGRSPRRRVPIWVVRVGDDLYVRSWRGVGGRWFRAAQARGQGHVSASGVEKDVTFVKADTGVEDAVDTAYRSKYARYPSYVEPMLSSGARATTLKLLPRTAEDQ
jgi:hypothetical protein